MKHAPTAPGPRPDTFWKQQRRAKLIDRNRVLTTAQRNPPIYTRPEPRKQGVKGKQK